MIPASTSAPAQTPSHAVLASAADWYARLRDGRAESRDRDAWRAWLAADEAHRTAWRQVEEITGQCQVLLRCHRLISFVLR